MDAWKRAGMDDCVTKPFTLKALAACLETWLPDAARKPVAEASEAPEPTVEAEPAAAAERAADGEPVIDSSVLDMLTEMGGDDSAELLDRVFGLYQDHGPQSFEALEQEMAGGDRNAIAKAAHALKSMSYNVGAKRVGTACAALEKAASSGEDVPLDTLLRAVADDCRWPLQRIAELRQSGEANADQPATGAAS